MVSYWKLKLKAAYIYLVVKFKTLIQQWKHFQGSNTAISNSLFVSNLRASPSSYQNQIPQLTPGVIECPRAAQ